MNQTIDQEPETAPARGKALIRFGPLVLILVGIAAFFMTGANQYLSLGALQENYEALNAFVAERFWFALGVFTLAYIAATALSLPGATVMSLLGGFLFGIWAGSLAVIIGATIGAGLLFIIARTAIGDSLRKRAGPWLTRMEDGFSENAFSYLLLLRVIPLFPFFIVNIVPALLGMRLGPYLAATFIGIIPGVFAFVSAGNGLGAVLEQGDDINLSGLLLQPEVLTPIIALSVLAMIPIIYRTLKGAKQS